MALRRRLRRFDVLVPMLSLRRPMSVLRFFRVFLVALRFRLRPDLRVATLAPTLSFSSSMRECKCCLDFFLDFNGAISEGLVFKRARIIRPTL